MVAEAGPSRLGQILIKHTSLTDEQLNEALDIQKNEGGRLGEILLKKNFILPHEILKALCFQMGLPYIDDLKANEIDTNLVADIPINYSKQKEVLPILRVGNTITVATSNPFSFQALEDIRILTGCDIRPVITSSMRIQDAINRVYEKSTKDIIEDIKDEFDETLDLEGPIDILDASENDAPVIKFVNSLIFRAIKEMATDIHVEPYDKELVIRFRLDGILYDVLKQPKRAHAAVSSRIKVMAQMDIAEKRLPQDGPIRIKLAGKDIDLRVSSLPTVHGERIVMRILEKGDTVLTLDQLGFSEKSRKDVKELIDNPHGMFLVTGPTGSGKSTTLASCLSILNEPGINILTVEDPIEYQIKGIGQTQVNPKIGLTFVSALRSFLRQDPDVIMVGEIRDPETAEIAINAALTGHLVFSTLHTNDSCGAAPRLLDMGIEPFLVASSLLGVIAQRLVRKVCTKCREAASPTDKELEHFNLTRKDVEGYTIYKATGCPTCTNKGYRGRTVIHELLLVDDELRKLIVDKSSASVLKNYAVGKGMIPLKNDGITKVLSGITTFDEIIRNTQGED